MPRLPHKSAPCPGPGYGHACHWTAMTGTRHGRCAECRRWRCNLYRNPNARPEKAIRNGAWSQAWNKRVQQEIAAARAVVGLTFGLKGAAQVHDAMMRAA